MPTAEPNDQRPSTSGQRFASTHWSVVLAAAKAASPEAEAALENLCIEYWYPLYAYLRKGGLAPHIAEDLTQEFFASRIVTRRIFQGVQPGAGRFRSWLLTSLQNMVRNEREKAQAAKRGGGQPHFPLDFASAEGRYAAEPAHHLTPEKLYDRSCALRLLELAMDQLRERYRREGKAEWFEELKSFLPGEHSTRSHAEVAARVGKSEDAVKTAVSRFRQEYGRLLEAEVKRIVDTPGAVKEELHHLLDALVD
jgi:RNA polymerase sigma factor (sigma-70 family)